MVQVLTIEQIGSQFDSEWVLLADPVVDGGGQITGGKVVAHSKDRDEVYRKDIELRLKVSATLFTGKMAHDSAIILCREQALAL
jgi:hypothetical protein